MRQYDLDRTSYRLWFRSYYKTVPGSDDKGKWLPATRAGFQFFKKHRGAEPRVGIGFPTIWEAEQSRFLLGIQDTLVAYVELDSVEYSNLRTKFQEDWELVVMANDRKKSNPDSREYFAPEPGARRTVIAHKDAIAEGEYGDLGYLKGDEKSPTYYTELTAFVQDAAGNRGSATKTDSTETRSAFISTGILIDGRKPVLASRKAKTLDKDDKGDTTIYAPLGGDVISGGGPVRDVDLPADENPAVYELNETLGSLKVGMKSKLSGLPEAVLTISSVENVDQKGEATGEKNTNSSAGPEDWFLDFGYEALKHDNRLSIDVSDLMNSPGAAAADSNLVTIWKEKDGKITEFAGSFRLRQNGDKALLSDGKKDYVFTFTPTDLAGNEGAKEERTGVTLDLKDIGFTNSFPIMEGTDNDLRTLGAASANVSLELDEAADTLAIIYKHVGPGSPVASKNDTITVGGDGMAKDLFTEYTVTGLEDGQKYSVRVDVRDAAGNWAQAGPDTFTYDADHALEPAAKLSVSYKHATALLSGEGKDVAVGGYKDDNKDDADDDRKVTMASGDTLTVTIQALTSGDKTAFLYRQPGTLTIQNGRGVDLIEKKSPGASQPEPGNTITLDANGWGSDGMRSISFRDTVSDDKLVIQFEGGGVTGAFTFPDTVITQDNDYAMLIVASALDTVARGDDFTVNVSIADAYGNVREKDSRFVNVTANQIGAVVPTGDVPISNGTDSFIANSGSATSFGSMVITVRDIVQQANGTFIHGVSNTIHVEGEGHTSDTASDGAADGDRRAGHADRRGLLGSRGGRGPGRFRPVDVRRVG